VLEMTGDVVGMTLLSIAADVMQVTGRVDAEFNQSRVRDSVVRLRALRRTWLPMWALRENTLARNIRRAARAMGAHLDCSPRARAW
jgi:hypothetical protein